MKNGNIFQLFYALQINDEYFAFDHISFPSFAFLFSICKPRNNDDCITVPRLRYSSHVFFFANQDQAACEQYHNKYRFSDYVT